MKRLLLSIIAIIVYAISTARTLQLIDAAWKFSPDSVDWRQVDLPHDWSIEGGFDINAPCCNDGGYLPTGMGYYTKTIEVPTIKTDNRYMLYFEGVYMNSDVRVNGLNVGGHPYGYTSFFCDITDALIPGENIIEIKVDNSKQRNSRWYSGSGIYRHVWLIEHAPLYLDPWSLYVRTDSLSVDSATVSIDVDFINALPDAEEGIVKIDIFDPNGERVASTQQFAYLPASAKAAKSFAITIPSPQPWSLDVPKMYTADVTASTLIGEKLDQISRKFGIRTIDVSTDGFRLNGQPVTINGACVHHDNGILGAASFDAAERRKAKLLKDAGFNAVRTSHNPPAPAFLDACDSLGLLVIDEAFDGWRDAKTEHDYAELIDEYWPIDLGNMILRDRNHPSIIAWSIGNEVIERKKIEVVTTAHKMAALCHSLDPTRPVTSALASWDDDWEIYDPLAAQLDITGYNYLMNKTPADHKRVPERVMWQTESFPRDAFANWIAVDSCSYILGDFVWTGIDYLGESGIGRHYYKGEVPGEHWERKLWPWHGALCGDIDITGMRKPISYYRDFLYNRDMDIYMAVREPNGYKGEVCETLWGTYPTYESWTWPGWEGKPIQVEVISQCPAVRLYVDDRLVGEQTTNQGNGWKAVFDLDYTPGVLRAEGVGKDCSATIATAAEPAAIRLTPDRISYKADGQDIAFVVAEIVDKNGTVVPTSDTELQFSIKGPAKIMATGSANMTDDVSYASHARLTNKGRAIVALRITDKGGPVELKCTSQKLKGQLRLNVK